MKYSKNLCFKLEFGGCFGGENTIGCFNRVYSVVIRLIGGFWGVFGVFHSSSMYANWINDCGLHSIPMTHKFSLQLSFRVPFPLYDTRISTNKKPPPTTAESGLSKKLLVIRLQL